MCLPKETLSSLSNVRVLSNQSIDLYNTSSGKAQLGPLPILGYYDRQTHL